MAGPIRRTSVLSRLSLIFAVLVVAVSPAAAQRGWQPDAWFPTPGPLVHDTTRDRVIMVDPVNTWMFENDEWVRLAKNPWPPLSRFEIAYDAARDRVVLSGGAVPPNSSQYSTDTWLFDGTRWSKSSVPGPTGRIYHAMAYDPIRERVVLYGGNNGTAETWTWDGAAWTQHHAVGPGARQRHTLCFDPASGKTLLLGGLRETETQTWGWDGQDWSVVATGGPITRRSHTMTYSPTLNRAVLYGGIDLNGNTRPLYDTWLFDGAEWTLLNEQRQLVDSNADLAFEPATGRVLLVQPSGALGRPAVYRLDGSIWSHVRDNLTSEIFETAIAHHAATGKTYMFGGYDLAVNQTPYGATWVLNGADWDPVGVEGPSARTEHAMVYDEAMGKIILQGGQTVEGLVGDTWAFDGEQWEHLTDDGPGGRISSGMAYDAAREQVVLYGGGSSSGVQTDTWLFDDTGWHKATATGPGFRIGSAMAYDAAREEVILFGGWSNADTWAWDGAAWTLRASVGPPGIYGSEMAFDENLGQIVLFGGENSASAGPNQDTWTWDGTQWTQLAVPPMRPAARRDHVMTFDRSSNSIVMLSGTAPNSSTRVSNTWEFADGRWTQRVRSFPKARDDLNIPATAGEVAFDETNQELVLVSSSWLYYTGTDRIYETWAWKNGGWEYRSVSNDPELFLNRWSITSDPATQTPLVVNSFYSSSAKKDESFGWAWDGSGWSLLYENPVNAPQYPALTPDPKNQRVLALAEPQPSGTGYWLWEWDGQEWSILDANGPALDLQPTGLYYGFDHQIAYDSDSDELVLIGKVMPNGGNQIFRETWTWDGATWTLAADYLHSPPYCSTSNAAFDPRSGSVVYSTTSGTWVWKDHVWTRWDSDPSVVGDLVFDPIAGKVSALWGGTVWRWNPGCNRADVNADDLLDSGDIQGFLELYFLQDIDADLNADGFLDLGDIQAFIAAFLQGC